jgi:four helix bundle protein
MTPDELKVRTFTFSTTLYRFARPLLRNVETRHVATQLIKAGTSVACNYRAACLSRTKTEWIAKIGVVREESDETLLWVLFIESAVLPAPTQEIRGLREEAGHIARIMAASYWTSRRSPHRRSREPGSPP